MISFTVNYEQLCFHRQLYIYLPMFYLCSTTKTLERYQRVCYTPQDNNLECETQVNVLESIPLKLLIRCIKCLLMCGTAMKLHPLLEFLSNCSQPSDTPYLMLFLSINAELVPRGVKVKGKI